MNSLFTIIASILSSGLIATFLSAFFNEEKERATQRRAKIENIYMNSQALFKRIGSNNFMCLQAIRGVISYDEALDFVDEAKDIPEKSQNLHMNIYMYEPTLIKGFEQAKKAANKLREIEDNARETFKRTGDARSFSTALSLELIAFEKSTEAYLNQIIELGAMAAAQRGIATESISEVRKAVQKILRSLFLLSKRLFAARNRP